MLSVRKTSTQTGLANGIDKEGEKMSYFGYNLDTNYGSVPTYTTEGNVPANFPPHNFMAIHTPSIDTIASKRFMTVHPIGGSPTLLDTNIPIEVLQARKGMTIGKTNTGVPIIMGEVVPESEIPKGATVTTMPIEIYGHSPLPVKVIIILAVVVAITLLGVSFFLTEYFKVHEAEKTRRHENDLVAEMQDVVDRREFDLNDDGVMDIEEITFGNGEIIRSPISDYGVEAMGASPMTINEGMDMQELLDMFERREETREWQFWLGKVLSGVVTVGGVAVGGWLIVKGIGEVRAWRAQKATQS